MFSILKRIMLTTVIAVGFMIGSMTVTAQADMPPTIAESACMIDVDTGKVLYQVYPTKWVHPASTTKIVTLITALDQYKDKLDQPLQISWKLPIRNLPAWGLHRAIPFLSVKPCGA